MKPIAVFQSNAEGNLINKDRPFRSFVYSDYSIEPHNHDFYEMNIILSGDGIHQIENACYNIKKGDVFVIPPLTVHSYHHTQNLNVQHIIIHKDFIISNAAESIKVQGYLQLMEIEPFLRQNSGNAMFLHLSKNKLNELQNELKFFDETGVFYNDEYLPLKNHTMWKIIYWLSHLLFKQINLTEKSSLNKYESAIFSTLEYIHQNYGQKLTVKILSEKVFLSRSTFLRSFFEICNCTPSQYILDYRLKKATEMLETGNLSKTEIAHLCGFYDLSHMERSMK